jgi:hypothetical protein
LHHIAPHEAQIQRQKLSAQPVELYSDSLHTCSTQHRQDHSFIVLDGKEENPTPEEEEKVVESSKADNCGHQFRIGLQDRFELPQHLALTTVVRWLRPLHSAICSLQMN